jgi:hypothetical protein
MAPIVNGGTSSSASLSLSIGAGLSNWLEPWSAILELNEEHQT